MKRRAFIKFALTTGVSLSAFPSPGCTKLAATGKSDGMQAPVREKIIKANGVDLASERFGKRSDPAILLISSQRWREELSKVKAPTLVIHGTDDPVLPFGHGKALSREIPGARILPLEGAGHEINPADWDTVISAILKHTAGLP